MRQLSFVIAILLSTTFVACQQKQVVQQTNNNAVKVSNLIIPKSIERVTKTVEEWKAELDDIEYKVLREAGTERAFTGDLWDNKKVGTYTCRGCELPLFTSDTKFKSGTGWPSFYQPIKDEFIAEKEDRKYGMVRVEVLCARCDGHLGHVFPDGPQPTGLRYCINSVSLDFVEEAKEMDKP